MKNIVIILIGAALIAVLLTLGVYLVFGKNPGYYFARFIAVPAGLAASGVGFLVYDSAWPKTKAKSGVEKVVEK